MKSEAQKRATRKYDRTHSKQFAVRFWYGKDDDIIRKLEATENKAELIRQAIRKMREGA